jgi:hypothetical protein
MDKKGAWIKSYGNTNTIPHRYQLILQFCESVRGPYHLAGMVSETEIGLSVCIWIQFYAGSGFRIDPPKFKIWTKKDLNLHGIINIFYTVTVLKKLYEKTTNTSWCIGNLQKVPTKTYDKVSQCEPTLIEVFRNRKYLFRIRIRGAVINRDLQARIHETNKLRIRILPRILAPNEKNKLSKRYGTGSK